ncbi:hypothetical protein QSJ18_16115 [Gordonia sp. ABSL1-1]|uniref:hypothetical protein n=1 Tax=Gordonia sp. ABSL1-1 TaxID=3053923 RepID=UPI0025734792|nr:hypothetical protein [Gordonia sp. ABSL1-1]MDL9938279.1 hypothetical protein [Gordonia sp. ABSL1-1]
MAQLSDAKIATVLDNAVAGINPVLDALAERDPLGLKDHTFHEAADHTSRLERVQHRAAKVFNVTDWPGTEGWSKRSMHKRASWWVSRIGTVNTGAVAFPGVFGAWTKKLPVSSVLGFANQATVLVAIAREYGVTDRAAQVQLLAHVLCARDLDNPDVGAASGTAMPDEPKARKKSMAAAVWETAKTLRAIGDELDRRPMPRLPFRMLGWIPLIGAPATYVGERFALGRAVKLARAWIVAHPGAVG